MRREIRRADMQATQVVGVYKTDVTTGGSILRRKGAVLSQVRRQHRINEEQGGGIYRKHSGLLFKGGCRQCPKRTNESPRD